MNTTEVTATAEPTGATVSAKSEHPIETLRATLKEWEEATRVATGIESRTADLKAAITDAANAALRFEPDSPQEIAAADKVAGLNSRLGLMVDRANIAADEARDKEEDVLSAARFALLALELQANEVRLHVREKVAGLVAAVWPHYRSDGAGRTLALESEAVLRTDLMTSLPASDRLMTPQDCARLLDLAAKIDAARAFVDGLRFNVRGL